jgi:hypothetical protein
MNTWIKANVNCFKTLESNITKEIHLIYCHRVSVKYTHVLGMWHVSVTSFCVEIHAVFGSSALRILGHFMCSLIPTPSDIFSLKIHQALDCSQLECCHSIIHTFYVRSYHVFDLFDLFIWSSLRTLTFPRTCHHLVSETVLLHVQPSFKLFNTIKDQFLMVIQLYNSERCLMDI